MIKSVLAIVLAVLRVLGIVADKRRTAAAKEAGRNETIVEARRNEDVKVASAKDAKRRALAEFDRLHPTADAGRVVGDRERDKDSGSSGL